MTDGTTGDEAAIRSMNYRYADAVTRRDFATVERLWAEEGRWVLTAPYDRTAEGRGAVIELLRDLLGNMLFFVQMPHAGVVAVTGDRATARWTMHEIGRVGPDGPGHQKIGQYEDELRRIDSQRVFTSRAYT